jgi:hypothetical protein
VQEGVKDFIANDYEYDGYFVRLFGLVTHSV